MSRGGIGSLRVRAELARPRLLHNGWWWAIAALLVASLGLAWWTHDLRRQTAERHQMQVLAAQERAASASSPAAPSLPPPYEASAREMLSQAVVPWPEALSAVESIQLPGVRVTRLDYSAAEASVTVWLHLSEQRQAVEFVDGINTGVPAQGAAWRWTLGRVELDRSTGASRAELMGRWRTK